MKFSYKFNNLLGAIYKKGNLVFTPDGHSVISPVGNRITIFDLRNNKTITLPVESRFDYTCIDISPNGHLLLAINEEGEAHMISLISQTIIHRYRFKRKIRCVKFSPDGKHFAVCKENNAFVFKAPGPLSGQFNSFIMERVFHGAYDETTCLDWSFDSQILAVGSKDMSVKLYPLDKWQNLRIYSLGNHTDVIVGCFFESSTYDMTTLSRNGQICIWECTIDPDSLKPMTATMATCAKRKKPNEDLEEDDVDVTKSLEQDVTQDLEALNLDEEEKKDEEKAKEVEKFFYKRVSRQYLGDEARKSDPSAVLTATAYHKKSKMLVTGFSNGAFFLHELPDLNMVHSLSISNERISTIAFNASGDWIGLGCGGRGQLLVWEWQSETYVMKQQGHSNNISCVCYSSDGQYLASGGEDGKVKLWNVQSAFNFITFTEHTNAVSAIDFCSNKRFLVSASLDGTARAFDLLRYRNFRTFASPKPVQFSSVSVDSAGDLVAVGGQDLFEIYLFAVKNGRLLEILAGHEAPISSLAFSPLLSSSRMVSAGWDGTVRVWDAIAKGADHETLDVLSDVLCVVFKPNGEEIACATLTGSIVVFDVGRATQLKCIEGRDDLGSGRAETDLVTAKKSAEAKAFTSLCYTADGECILAGGHSKFICIYHIGEAILLKKFEVTQNRSLDAVDDFINRRKMCDFGNVDLVEEREETEGGNVRIKLPGVRQGDHSARNVRPEIRVFSLQFAPTGQQFAAATTEGLLVYSLHSGLVFDPFELEIDITPKRVRKAIKKQDHVNAITMAMKLNEASLIQDAVENVPVNDVNLVLRTLDEKYTKRLLVIVAAALETSTHLEYYLVWCENLLTIFGPKMKPQQNVPALLALEKALVKKYDQLANLCDHNKYTMQFVQTKAEGLQKKKEKKEEEEETTDMNEILDETYE